MASEPRDQVTRLLHRIGAGEEASETLMPLIYAELRSLAERLMRTERQGHTLQPTALVNEAFVRLVQGELALGEGRREFLAVAARAMRNLLVDHARRHGAEKRGGSRERVTLSGVEPEFDPVGDLEILDLHAALEDLERLDPRQVQILEMCYFGGMSGQEIAEHLGVHRNTVVNELRMARAWLHRALGGDSTAS